MIKEKLPTATDMPKPIGDFIIGKHDAIGEDGVYYHYENVCVLLRSYAELQTTHLQARIEELKEELEKWKYDKKESGDKMFELKLEIKRLKSENEDLKSAIKDMRDELYKGNYDG